METAIQKIKSLLKFEEGRIEEIIKGLEVCKDTLKDIEDYLKEIK